MANDAFLYDIKIKRNLPYYAQLRTSPTLSLLLQQKSLELVRLYQARVAVKTGRLRASAEAHTPALGGKRNDRLVGKVTIAGPQVKADRLWRGAPFYYGELHEEGSPSKRDRFPGAHELREAAQQWRAT